MSQVKHTPGPWKAYPHDCCPGNWHWVAGLPGLGKTEVHLAEANAHLIAAAPDLLAALETWVDVLCINGDDCPLEYHQKARAAIAKARGE